MADIMLENPLICPTCGNKNDALGKVPSHKDVNTAKEGDFMVCAYCGTICRFDDQLRNRKASPLDMEFLREKQPKAYGEIMVMAMFFSSAASPISKIFKKDN